MFFLTLDFGSITVAALGGMLLSLLAMAVAYLVLRKCGIHFMYRRKRRSANSVDEDSAQTKNDSAIEGELTEEELLVILSAAAMEALGATDAKRFRVVAFRRL